MAKLTAAKRKKIPASKFGLPEERAYPMPDRKHAAVAKAYAERYATPSQRARIDAKANRILGKSGSLARHAAMYHKGR
jgi:hypothetical protein